MKNVFFFFLLLFVHSAAFSQSSVTLYASGGAATYTTGNATAGSRTDNTIISTSTTQGGYAVFDLTSIPAGSMINSCTIGFYATYGGSGTASGWNTYGYAGNLATVTSASALFTDIFAGTSLTTASYGTASGNQILASTAAITSFLQANAGGKVSICFTGGNTRIYTISGETGPLSTTTAGHTPYLTISYCPAPTGVTASATPGTLCQGASLHLTGAGSGSGTLSWSWSGPGSFSSVAVSPTVTTGPASGGVYSLTVTNTCATGAGSFTATTPVVTLNALPVISGGLGVCTGGTSALSGSPAGGSWVSGSGAVATIGASSGILSGVATGTAVITYTDLSSCSSTATVTDNAASSPISGPSPAFVCIGSTITLTDSVASGTWTSGSGNAAVSSTGVVTGITAGPATISYITGGCAPVTLAVTVSALPMPITGSNIVCAGSSTTLSDASPGGVWGTSASSIATVSSFGIFSGVAPGTATITYSDAVSHCQATMSVSVQALPPAITGPSSFCLGSSIILADALGTGSWSTSSFLATIDGGGNVSGISSGVAVFSYTDPITLCAATYSVSINPLPATIGGSSVVCQAGTSLLTDASVGGRWTSSDVTLAIVNATSGVDSGVAPGVVTITYTLPTSCATTQTITVNPAPVSIAAAGSATTFCPGGNVVLSGVLIAGDTYQWEIGGTSISGATNSIYTASITGSYKLITTNGFGCGTASTVIPVSATIPAILRSAASLGFCIGGYDSLTVSTGNALGVINYQWERNGIAISGATDSTYIATLGGQYNAAVSISGASGTCSTSSDTDLIVVHSLPIPTISFNGTLLTTSSGYTAFQWYLNTVLLSGATRYSLTPPTNGSYQVLVTDSNGCKGFSLADPLTNVGVSQVFGTAAVSISPNPVVTALHITAPVAVRVVITDMEGRIVAQQANATDVFVGNLPGALYLVTVYDVSGNRLAASKFVKQ